MLNYSEPYCFELIDNMSLCPADGVYLPLSSAIAGNIDRFYLDETTGIDNTYDIDTIEYSPIYTITGIIVDGEKLTPGLYISKGKKIIVRWRNPDSRDAFTDQQIVEAWRATIENSGGGRTLVRPYDKSGAMLK